MRPFHRFASLFLCFLPTLLAAQWTARPGFTFTNFASGIAYWDGTFYLTDQEEVFRSVNFGQTWQRCVLDPGATNSQQIIAGPEGVFAGFGDGRILVSHDGGNAWSEACPAAPTGTSHLAVLDGDIFAAGDNNTLSVFHPATGQWQPVAALAAVTINRLAVHGARVFASTSDGVKYSSDHGVSWQSVTGPLPRFADLMAVGNALWALAPDQGFRVSNDGGSTWSSGSLGGAGGARRACYDPVNNRFYYTRLVQAPSYLNVWTYTPGVGSQRLTDFQVNPSQLVAYSGVVLALASQGILRSTDNGAHWRSEYNGFSANSGVTVEGALGEHFLKGGPILSLNDGQTWFQPVDSGAGGYGLRNYARLEDTLFALDVWAGNYYSLYKSVPPYTEWPVQDTSWIFASSDGKLTNQGADLLYIAYTPNLWTLYRSPDRGLTWTLSGHFPLETRVALVHHDWLIAIDENELVWRSLDGANWTQTAQLPELIGAYRLKSENGQLVATSNGQGGLENLMRSRDDGLTWNKINANVTDPFGLGFDRAAVWGDTLAVANALGCWLSQNGGDTWTDVTDGLPWVDLYELLFYQGQLFRSGGPNYGRTLENIAPVRAGGTVYWDQNHNDVREPQEPFLAGYPVRMRRNGAVRLTGPDGAFLLTGTLRPDTVEVVLPANYGQVSPAFAVVEDTLEGQAFGVWYPPGQLDRRISVIALDPFRPGFNTRLEVRCLNAGSETAPATVRLNLPAGVALVSVDPPAAVATDDSVRWEIPLLEMFGSATLRLTVKTAAATPLGALLNFTAETGPIQGDLQPVDNVDTAAFTVTGAYDPNDKQVNQGATLTPAQVADGRSFHYTIRFQNTGTYPAGVVRVVDTLSEEFDLSTLRLLGASHPVRMVLHDGRVLEFVFDPIGLPAITADPLGSSGFVQFSVQPRTGLTTGDRLRNGAAIYFDYNLPVLTNITLVRIEGMVPALSVPDHPALLPFPNPANLRFSADLPAAGTVEVFDAAGRLFFKQRAAAGGRTQVECGAWPPGPYTVVWHGSNGRQAGKVVVQRL